MLRTIGFALCYSEDRTEGERAIAPLRGFGAPLANMIGPMPYLDQQELLTKVMPYDRQNYWHSGLICTPPVRPFT